jgi:hypothetical protein
LFVYLKQGLFTEAQTLEYSLLVLFLLALYVFVGAGQWSIDHHFTEQSDAPLPPERAFAATIAHI